MKNPQRFLRIFDISVKSKAKVGRIGASFFQRVEHGEGDAAAGCPEAAVSAVQRFYDSGGGSGISQKFHTVERAVFCIGCQQETVTGIELHLPGEECQIFLFLYLCCCLCKAFGTAVSFVEPTVFDA